MVDLPAVIEEGETSLAVDKPPDVLVVPGRGEDPSDSLHHRLQLARGERLWVVHRLDRETSGVLVFARSAEAHRGWSMAFEAGQIEKSYLALCAGRPTEKLVRVPLVDDDALRRVRAGAPGEKAAKPAQTKISLVRFWPEHGLSLVRCLPLTGRRHQIRVHLALAGAPILCDPLYGSREAPFGAQRTMLHAERLVPPPRLGAGELYAPLPRDFGGVLSQLG